MYMSKKSRRANKPHRKHKKYTSKHRKHKRHHLYRKRREILSFPGSKGMPLFTNPEKHKSQKILVNYDNSQSGNMIMGLRNM